MRRIAQFIGFREIIATSGLGMAFAGLWQIYPPYALVVVGGTLFGLSLWGAR